MNLASGLILPCVNSQRTDGREMGPKGVLGQSGLGKEELGTSRYPQSGVFMIQNINSTILHINNY